MLIDGTLRVRKYFEPMKTVGVVGAGPGGLCAARHVLKIEGLKLLMWERSTGVGGTWRYTESVGVDDHGLPVHSSIYRSLRTDIPKETMAFPDYPFPKDGPSFVTHSTVLQYLQDYSDHFNITSQIKFSNNVESITPTEEGDTATKWNVRVNNMRSGDISEVICDVIIVCNGHFSSPRLPEVAKNKFTGTQMHSHDYRTPERYSGHNVLILGMGTSGLDISLDVASVAKQVYISHELPHSFPSELPSNVTQVKGMVDMTSDTAVLSDGQQLKVDDVIYCTGYNYVYPFLAESCGIEVNDQRVTPLYKHLINIKHNTMALIGIPSQIISFPLLNFQALYYIAYLTNNVDLPSPERMTTLVEKDFEEFISQENHARHYHRFRDRQMAYMDDLASEANATPLPIYIREMFAKVIHRIVFEFTKFKDYKYDVKEDGTFTDYYDK